MKSFLYAVCFYVCLALLFVGCVEDEPQPSYIKAEVVGPDCESGWYILNVINKNDEDAEQSRGRYLGQIRSGYVTTNSLPAAYRQAGLQIEVALELNENESPSCVTVHMMHPAVVVKHINYAPVLQD
ncbi:hypothetical protein ACFSKU_20235 [Pontibacter silvestris]|uniref:Uncharacterized protein n=1 Tax=Pontibacter silvestris TaxID=2305183 RepID=A0ABW4X3I5_9BACT|nr:hypothetical protein [Pontibacter silvestris]MCC9137034.1 hypothetical protein [Pontibacter silvestris]